MTDTKLRTLSATAFALAVLAGIAEGAVSVAAIQAQQGIDGALGAQMAFRGVIFAAALACAWFLARGRRWAWWALLAGLGVLGLASMVLPMAADLAAGGSWYDTLGGDTSAVMPAIRVLHIAFVVAGVVTMLQPRVRLSLDGARRSDVAAV
ncbi:hypothetical protein [Promicromonospora iranensis]|uniref:DUF4149 domain-containing protein n=1 Tax=Promicromonospora iranensis TaxID=1105144 RepID=A0ABU2CWN5_9MICO|nr:hypothetical protein [Promicromonospora iranensis]MDR7385764.1 hypothetical protein [Promicromonospora iranensis]